MRVELYDAQNNLIASTQTEDHNVNYQLNVDPEAFELKGLLYLNNLDISAKDYIKLLRAITKKTAAQFVISNDVDGKEIYISTLFLNDISMQYQAGYLTLRASIFITEDNMDEYYAFLESHDML